MVVFPNCKINLGLHITARRSDGYHNLETVFLPVPVCDAVEVIASAGVDGLHFSASGLPVSGSLTDNICYKAWQLIKHDFPHLPGIQLHLHKVIPMGAGLGGGSADGAFTLMLLNKKFKLQLSQEQLLQYSAQLGSDCPFFIINTPSYAQGRGELLQPIDIDLKGFQLLLVNPGIHINTGWAFQQITPAPPAKSLMTVLQQPVTAWRALLDNDFEQPVLHHYPQLAALKQSLYDQGAIYASMSGSGSTFYALFPADAAIPTAQYPPDYFVRLVRL